MEDRMVVVFNEYPLTTVSVPKDRVLVEVHRYCMVVEYLGFGFPGLTVRSRTNVMILCLVVYIRLRSSVWFSTLLALTKYYPNHQHHSVPALPALAASIHCFL